MSAKHKLQRNKESGIYYVRIQIGNQRKRFAFGKDRSKARAALRKLEKELKNGNIRVESKSPLSQVSGSKIMLDELSKMILEWVRENRALATYHNYEMHLRIFRKFLGNRPVESITRLDLEQFYIWAKKYHSKSLNGGNASLRVIKTVLLWAEEMDVCECPVKKFPRISETPPETIRFNDEDMKKFIAAIPDEYSDFRDLTIFGFLTGLRPQELRLLEQHHVREDDHGNVYLLIERHKTAKVVRMPKPRSVPLVPEAVKIARTQIAKHPKSEYVFLNGVGKPYTGGVLRQRFKRCCKRAGIKVRPPYAMRHTFGSMQAEANINQACLSHLMGHSQIRTTMRYVAPTDEYHREAVALISGRIMNCAKKEEAGE